MMKTMVWQKKEDLEKLSIENKSDDDKSNDDEDGVTKAGGFGGAGHHQHPFLALQGLSAATAKQN